ncbi:hypothetical protein M514_12276 [Trichuris suis]|uniref:DUF7107 domain-containing protein n=1 Tax=Trichuris suis TaxID=68888 RepID=A0A085N6A2_9BILA|nr:hypothetical protein M514_12276 [Trichuris suis]
MKLRAFLSVCAILLLIEVTPVLLRTALTTTCSVNRDCNWQALCWYGKCEKAKPTGQGDCISDSDCSGRDGCRFGICFTLIAIPAQNSTNKTEPFSGPCRQHEDCPKYDFCIDTHCVKGEPSNDECTNGRRCPAGGICWDQLCWVPPGKPSDDQTEENTCSSHNDCEGDMLCHVQEKRCKAGVLAVDCESDEDCARNAFCKNHKCLKFVPECIKQEDCSGKKLCDNGKCVAGQMTRTKCNESSPCPNKGKCKFSFCWNLESESQGGGKEVPSKDSNTNADKKPEEEKSPSKDAKTNANKQPDAEKGPSGNANTDAEKKPEAEKSPNKGDTDKPSETPKEPTENKEQTPEKKPET